MAERKGGPSFGAIVLSTAASVTVCLLLVALADDHPAVLMDWEALETAQTMDAYNTARRAGDSAMLKANPDPVHHARLNALAKSPAVGKKASPAKLSSSQEAAQETKHLEQLANKVWPSDKSKRRREVAQTSEQMLAHYKQVSTNAWPSHANAHPKLAAPQTAEQELAHFRKISSMGLPKSSAAHGAWHQTAHQLLAHYKAVSSQTLPDKAPNGVKHLTAAESSKQELAHLKKLSSEIWPSEHAVHRSRQSAKQMMSHHKKLSDASMPKKHHAQHLAGNTQMAHHQLEHSKAAAEHFARSQKLSETIDGGLQITDVKVGDGDEPTIGDNVKVHYTGKLADGQVFDSGDITFKFGEGQVIKGWDIGLKGMKEGGERELVIPPKLAYGSRGTPGGPIPPDATLHFDVKLLRV